jgi:hypothetical protein
MKWSDRLLTYFSRKFVLTAIALLGGLWLAWEGKLTSELTLYVGTVLTPYIGANVIQRLKGENKDGNSNED